MTRATCFSSLLGIGFVCLFCAISAPSARADAIYTYTGNHFSTVFCCGVTTSNFESGTVTFSAPLAANLTEADVSSLVTAFFFTDGVQTASNTTTSPHFVVSTNSSGQITAWDFEAFTFTTGVPEFQTTNGLFTCRPNGCTTGNGDSVSLTNVQVVAQNSRPGTWQSPSTVPEPSSLLLLSSGLLGLGQVLRYRRKRRNIPRCNG